MSERLHTPLAPFLIDYDTPEYAAIAGWPYEGDDAYVTRLLRDDIPQRLVHGNCRMWGFLNPEGDLTGFGTLDVGDECAAYTGGVDHPYIPLLGKKPNSTGRGYCESITRYLVDEAALMVSHEKDIHPELYLDVYVTNLVAIHIYGKLKFEIVSPAPIAHAEENGRLYHVMAKRVEIAGS